MRSDTVKTDINRVEISHARTVLLCLVQSETIFYVESLPTISSQCATCSLALLPLRKEERSGDTRFKGMCNK